MLREFYDFIAKKINSYFQSLSADGLLQKGESFCLKLDDVETVENVAIALKELANDNNAMGIYEYTCRDGSVYHTYTLKVINGEVIIAAQIEGMTNDFLCATLRNAANDEGKPLLMISSNPIDSAKSGSRDMCANGMPFYADNLMSEIRRMVEVSTQLTFLEKRILDFELKRRDADVFSDKASLYEYRDLLSIMSSGSIDDNNYVGFRLFPVNGKTDYQNYGKSQIDKEIKNNHDLFERVDRSIRFGNLESDLSDDFEESFVIRIEKERKNDPENWSRLFTYAEMLAAMQKKQFKKDNPLQINLENIYVYGDMPLNVLPLDDKVLIRNDGTMKSKKRIRSLIVFNPDKFSVIHIRFECNARILNSDISQDDTSFVREGKNLIFKFEREDISFHKIEIGDSVNNITYIFKICIIDISAEYLVGTIKRNYVIDYKKNRKNCKIKLLGVGTDLTFNPNGSANVSQKLDDNLQYDCHYDARLHLYATEEELANYGSGIVIDINFAGILVPFVLYPDETKSKEIIGRTILRDKFASKSSFEINSEDHIYKDSQEYFAKTNLLRELRLEQHIIENHIEYGRCRQFRGAEIGKIEEVKLKQNSELHEAYCAMLDEFQKNSTVPTLAYLSENLLESVKNFLNAFNALYAGLKDGGSLSVEQENALLIGSLSVGRNIEEILLTPFHPLNLAYQLELLKETDFEFATDVVIDRLNSINLLPYLQRNKKIYRVSDQLFSQEWKYYAPVENRTYRGNRRYVPKLIEEKITEFVLHFRYIFDDINNKTVRLNLINMGDCRDVFVGVAQFFIHSLNKTPDIDRLKRFEIHIYTDDPASNAFSNIKEYTRLKEYLSELKLTIATGTAMNSLEGVLSKNVECYFHVDQGDRYEYAHISFYEMELEITSETATMNQIETGISLGGIVSGIPSSKYGQKYRTGFGTKYAPKTDVVNFAEKYNALIQVGDTGNPFYSGTGISTQIDSKAEEKMDYIYKASNWVVFVDPKVDLDFFSEKEANSDLLIIHYSDQYTSSSGYDAITVTRKSHQYSKVIQEYLKEKGVNASLGDVAKIINLFNAVNGDWLLRLVSSKKMIGANKDSTFSREKISIVAAIKFMLAFLKHPNIVWVPISLEEMLRVSGGVGLSTSEGILSYKNLGFEKGPTSDDLLFIGLNHSTESAKIYLYPIEVKTGINDNSVITKAFEQVSATASGLHNAMNSEEKFNSTILYKVNRNFLMQLLVTSCKKMKVYHVDDSQNWDVILDQFRMALLNEHYMISDEIKELLGKGAVLSFRKSLGARKTSFKEDTINFIEMPDTDEFDLILDSVEDIYKDIQRRRDSEFLIFEECAVDALTGDTSKIAITELEKEIEFPEQKELEKENPDNKPDPSVLVDKIEEDKTDVKQGMKILFGTNLQNGDPILWEPNDTDILFHTNTGIIGTMGTGKTQFTKSLITQLYRSQEKNVGDEELGILIFDYKGDYNESKMDFVEATNAKIFKPYALPINPLAIIETSVFKPLLPVHTANNFRDTIAKIYGLGPKQKAILTNCIMKTYEASGIYKADVKSWKNEAPTFDQVYQRYLNDEDIKKGDSLSAAMDELGEYEVFEKVPSKTKSLFDVLKGVVVIDLSGYPSTLQNLIIAIMLDLFYTQMQSVGSSKLEGKYRQLTKFILVDEADNFMSQDFPSLKKILKEGREFGVGTILSTQFLKHFASGEDDYAKYILTWVVHNVADLKNSDVDFVFKTEAKSAESQLLYNDIKKLQKHNSIIKISSEKPKYVKDKAFWELFKEMKED
ncbi:helicase HerA domain-containing protein [Mediterraneibacter agrestimuris]|uniref:helicase HerA domain-containing protein n=1 Tax=Mediterraneibacter agrestimuris TaxID=2941333 RepID=UPI00203C177D|nr:DUF87 domain-containing protein [Mediterraneibacter agrestimuris]